MIPWRFLASFFLAIAMPVSARAGAFTSASDWPQFRGRHAAGVADGQNPPVYWNTEAWSNVRWKTAIPGLGHASPVISRSRVFIVTAISSNPDPRLRVGLYGDVAPVQEEPSHCWQLYCLSKYTGAILWTRTVYEGVPKIKRHPKSTHANSTPATDGIHLAVFLGSEGLYCYDFFGNLLWKRDLGILDSGYRAHTGRGAGFDILEQRSRSAAAALRGPRRCDWGHYAHERQHPG